VFKASPSGTKAAASSPLSPTAGTVGAATPGPAAAVIGAATHRIAAQQSRARAHTPHGASARLSSLRRSAQISTTARGRFIYEALLKHLARGLFCHHGGSWSLGGGHLIAGWPQWWWTKKKAS
ncbi:MAG TPA: hypothetical protein VG186_10755, partial [Solirubrobacteraceae bacterium]|nr:hypothetical protein [Solirubrobacteraceae bacterium]